jgi:hypothetical protein
MSNPQNHPYIETPRSAILNFSYILFPAILLSGITLAYLSIFYLFRAYYKLKKRHPPFTNNLLRAPGHSLLKRLDDLDEETVFCLCALFIAPLFFYSAFVSHLYFKGRELNLTEAILWATVCLAFITYFLVKTLKHLRERRFIRLGYEGEVVVGQELNQLMLKGHYVYHDFPADNFSIDHIVVGKSGIFAVETKVRSIPTRTSPKNGSIVEYNGKLLAFPNGDDFITIDQAQRQALWLSKWIDNAIGKQVAARAIVAVPGWFVKRTSAEGITVVNPKQFPSLFEHVKPRPLSDEMITRIVHQLDQKCRDVEPGSTSHDSERL